MDKRKTFLDKCFKDKNNQLVLAQKLNIPLALGLTCTLLAYLFSKGTIHSLFQTLAFGALFTWSYLEIRSGVNYFRQALGVLVFVIIVANRLK